MYVCILLINKTNIHAFPSNYYYKYWHCGSQFRLIYI